MIHKIKCPKCKSQFTVDLGEKIPNAQEFAITQCERCGFPLINKNGTDNWELLKPSDMMGLPKELQLMIAEQLMPPDEMSSLAANVQKIKDAMNATTPHDRVKIFVPVGVCNSEGCPLVLGPSEWGMFAALSNMPKRAIMRDALHHIVTKDYEQKTTDN